MIQELMSGVKGDKYCVSRVDELLESWTKIYVFSGAMFQPNASEVE